MNDGFRLVIGSWNTIAMSRAQQRATRARARGIVCRSRAVEVQALRRRTRPGASNQAQQRRACTDRSCPSRTRPPCASTSPAFDGEAQVARRAQRRGGRSELERQAIESLAACSQAHCCSCSLRVQRVAQTRLPTRLIASTVTRIASPGSDHDPGREVEVVERARRQHRAPLGRRRLHAQAEEAERGDVEDGRREAECRVARSAAAAQLGSTVFEHQPERCSAPAMRRGRARSPWASSPTDAAARARRTKCRAACPPRSRYIVLARPGPEHRDRRQIASSRIGSASITSINTSITRMTQRPASRLSNAGERGPAATPGDERQAAPTSTPIDQRQARAEQQPRQDVAAELVGAQREDVAAAACATTRAAAARSRRGTAALGSVRRDASRRRARRRRAARASTRPITAPAVLAERRATARLPAKACADAHRRGLDRWSRAHRPPRMRGLTTPYSTSTSRLTADDDQSARATRMPALNHRRSRADPIASMIHLPMPGHEKIVSVRTAPPSSAPACRPIHGDHRRSTRCAARGHSDHARSGDSALGARGAHDSPRAAPPASTARVMRATTASGIGAQHQRGQHQMAQSARQHRALARRPEQRVDHHRSR